MSSRDAAYPWREVTQAIYGDRREGWVWIETKHSTLCGLHATGHSTCTCEPERVGRYARIRR